MVDEVAVFSEKGLEFEVKVTEVQRKEEGGSATKKAAAADAVRWEKFLPRMVLRVLLIEADDSTRQIISALLRKCSFKGWWFLFLLLLLLLLFSQFHLYFMYVLHYYLEILLQLCSFPSVLVLLLYNNSSSLSPVCTCFLNFHIRIKG